jgi:hypothetical protein
MSFEKRRRSVPFRTIWFAISLAFLIAAALAPAGLSRAYGAVLSVTAAATPTASPCPTPPGPLSTPVPC